MHQFNFICRSGSQLLCPALKDILYTLESMYLPYFTGIYLHISYVHLAQVAQYLDTFVFQRMRRFHLEGRS